MFTISAFSHLVNGFIAIHRRNRNAALMNELPDLTRRDIGWPERYRKSDRHEGGFWLWRARR